MGSSVGLSTPLGQVSGAAGGKLSRSLHKPCVARKCDGRITRSGALFGRGSLSEIALEQSIRRWSHVDAGGPLPRRTRDAKKAGNRSPCRH